MTRSTSILLLMAGLGAGCTPAYTVHVNTFSELQEPLGPTASIYVFADPNSRNPILADVLAAKVRALLEGHGYTIADKAEGAGSLVTLRAGIDTTQVMDYAPVSRPFGGGYYGFHGGRFRGLGYGYTAYVPYLSTVYAHWLEMRLFRPEPGGKPRPRPVWIGEAVVGMDNPELRVAANYLLIGLTDYFAMDTGRWVSLRLKENDPRIQGLAEVQ